MYFLLKVYGVGVSCRILYSITSVGEERLGATCNLSAVVFLYLCGFCLKWFPLPLGAWDELRYFIVAFPEPSI